MYWKPSCHQQKSTNSESTYNHWLMLSTTLCEYVPFTNDYYLKID